MKFFSSQTIALLLCCALMGCASTPKLTSEDQASFNAFVAQAKSVNPTSNSLRELKVDTTLPRRGTTAVSLQSGSQAFRFASGASYVHLIQIPENSTPYILALNMAGQAQYLVWLPSLLLLDAEFNELSRMELKAENFQWAAGSTAIQDLKVPTSARYALLYSLPENYGKEIVLALDVGIATSSSHHLVSPFGQVFIQAKQNLFSQLPEQDLPGASVKE
ncbi:MAG: hypothetical protein JNN30_09470 [Rhodanobacteraceae bacterium]|nr:hypothetical protein [Rhodanobacteraceae bacterium]